MLNWTVKYGHYGQILSVARYWARVNETIEENLSRVAATDIDCSLFHRAGDWGFRYDETASLLVCQGPGRPTPLPFSPGAVAGEGAKGAGNCPGQGAEGMTITLRDLEEALLVEPVPVPSYQESEDGELRYRGMSSWGRMNLLDPKATLLARKRRRVLGSKRAGKQLCCHDLRFRVWEPEVQDRTRALLVAIMDKSASMDPEEQELAGKFFYWLVRGLKRKYHRLDTVYVSHDYTAEEVPEEKFFSIKSTGGTRFSAAYRLAWQIISGRFTGLTAPKIVVHCTDGDNLPSDEEEAIFWLEKLLDCCLLVGYGEVRGSSRDNSRIGARQKINHPAFVTVRLGTGNELYAALRALLGGN